MKIYSVSAITAQEGHSGYEFFTSKREAQKAERDWKEKDADSTILDGPHEIPLTKAGVLRALNRFGGHPNNG